ncbi:hypothetical protein E_162 [Cronobacter phage vB_CsaM_leE]|uniref:Uncharacterized protein n=3 Tax=Pseudotevenvirus TaxID=2842979 RepID=A0A1W5N173_9CAUD|nr:hypothetical protein HWB00_gp164 [Cronobacter phage vB_CsaM_leB]YP_009831457.1 hypothetical protein HWB01_gp161 [Cronobacter phage vB_CsaM_leE]AOG16290.1 hypothetical protein B_164 [Cronobacter phage vB_CsaM_leB]AOG16569.1 hypothetical protein N_164 [Cronobacter phage vB_CsaM_leN]AON97170.1 hypothetical protein E_162 [Cronobacter phage vB_CsaM_leE]
MKLDRELSMAIRTIEMMLDKLSAKEEFCVSDIEADLVEWRGALYEATKGNDPLFDEYDVYNVKVWNTEYRFKWPGDAYGHIQTIYVTGGMVFATSVGASELPINPNSKVTTPNPLGHTTVCLGMAEDFSPNYSGWIEASKTNLKRV